MTGWWPLRWRLRRFHAETGFNTREPGDAAAVMAGRARSLLIAGVPAKRVWQVLASEHDLVQVAPAVAQALNESVSVANALARGPSPAWRVLAAAWQIAEQSGSALGPTLDRLTIALAEIQQLAERREVLLAAPRATIRLIAVLPFVGIGLAWVLGFDPLRVLLSAGGLLLAFAGIFLLICGVLWSRAMANRVARSDWVDGFELELMWVALAGELTPPPRCVAWLTRCQLYELSGSNLLRALAADRCTACLNVQCSTVLQLARY